MPKVEVDCVCGGDKNETRNRPKTVYVIRRADGGFAMPDMFFTEEGAMKHVNQIKELYRDHITPTQPNRSWEREHYLVKCEIVEKKIIC